MPRRPITSCTPAEWRAAINQLQACCPPVEGFAWRFIWTSSLPEDDEGGCHRVVPATDGKKGQMIVKILKGMSQSQTLDTLIHEMAHAYDTWTHHGWSCPHGATFWDWVGRIYCRYWGETYG